MAATKFVQKFGRRLLKDFGDDIYQADLKDAFTEAIDSLPRKDLKKELRHDFHKYYLKLKKLTKWDKNIAQKKTKPPEKQCTRDELAQSEKRDRTEVGKVKVNANETESQPSQFPWLQKVIKALQKPGNVEAALKLLYEESESDVSECLEKQKPNRAKRLALQIQKVITTCHLKVKFSQSQEFTDTVLHLFSALLSVYIDLCSVYCIKKVEKKKKYGNEFCSYVRSILMDKPETQLEVVLQSDATSKPNTKFLNPFIRRCIFEQPASLNHCHYLKQVLVIQQVKDRFEPTVCAELVEHAKKLTPLDGFYDWLQKTCPSDILSKIQLKKEKSFRTSKISLHIVLCASEEVLALLNECLLAQSAQDVPAIEEVGEADIQNVQFEQTENLFFIDTGKPTTDTPQPSTSQISKTKTKSASKKGKTISTLKELGELIVKDDSTPAKSPRRLDSKLVNSITKSQDLKDFFKNEIVSIKPISLEKAKTTEEAEKDEESNKDVDELAQESEDTSEIEESENDYELEVNGAGSAGDEDVNDNEEMNDETSSFSEAAESISEAPESISGAPESISEMNGDNQELLEADTSMKSDRASLSDGVFVSESEPDTSADLRLKSEVHKIVRNLGSGSGSKSESSPVKQSRNSGNSKSSEKYTEIKLKSDGSVSKDRNEKDENVLENSSLSVENETPSTRKKRKQTESSSKTPMSSSKKKKTRHEIEVEAEIHTESSDDYQNNHLKGTEKKHDKDKVATPKAKQKLSKEFNEENNDKDKVNSDKENVTPRKSRTNDDVEIFDMSETANEDSIEVMIPDSPQISKEKARNTSDNNQDISLNQTERQRVKSNDEVDDSKDLRLSSKKQRKSSNKEDTLTTPGKKRKPSKESVEDSVDIVPSSNKKKKRKSQSVNDDADMKLSAKDNPFDSEITIQDEEIVSPKIKSVVKDKESGDNDFTKVKDKNWRSSSSSETKQQLDLNKSSENKNISESSKKKSSKIKDQETFISLESSMSSENETESSSQSKKKESLDRKCSTSDTDKSSPTKKKKKSLDGNSNDGEVGRNSSIKKKKKSLDLGRSVTEESDDLFSPKQMKDKKSSNTDQKKDQSKVDQKDDESRQKKDTHTPIKKAPAEEKTANSSVDPRQNKSIIVSSDDSCDDLSGVPDISQHLKPFTFVTEKIALPPELMKLCDNAVIDNAAEDDAETLSSDSGSANDTVINKFIKDGLQTKSSLDGSPKTVKSPRQMEMSDQMVSKKTDLEDTVTDTVSDTISDSSEDDNVKSDVASPSNKDRHVIVESDTDNDNDTINSTFTKESSPEKGNTSVSIETKKSPNVNSKRLSLRKSPSLLSPRGSIVSPKHSTEKTKSPKSSLGVENVRSQRTRLSVSDSMKRDEGKQESDEEIKTPRSPRQQISSKNDTGMDKVPDIQSPRSRRNLEDSKTEENKDRELDTEKDTHEVDTGESGEGKQDNNAVEIASDVADQDSEPGLASPSRRSQRQKQKQQTNEVGKQDTLIDHSHELKTSAKKRKSLVSNDQKLAADSELNESKTYGKRRSLQQQKMELNDQDEDSFEEIKSPNRESKQPKTDDMQNSGPETELKSPRRSSVKQQRSSDSDVTEKETDEKDKDDKEIRSPKSPKLSDKEKVESNLKSPRSVRRQKAKQNTEASELKTEIDSPKVLKFNEVDDEDMKKTTKSPRTMKSPKQQKSESDGSMESGENENKTETTRSLRKPTSDEIVEQDTHKNESRVRSRRIQMQQKLEQMAEKEAKEDAPKQGSTKQTGKHKAGSTDKQEKDNELDIDKEIAETEPKTTRKSLRQQKSYMHDEDKVSAEPETRSTRRSLRQKKPVLDSEDNENDESKGKTTERSLRQTKSSISKEQESDTDVKKSKGPAKKDSTSNAGDKQTSRSGGKKGVYDFTSESESENELRTHRRRTVQFTQKMLGIEEETSGDEEKATTSTPASKQRPRALSASTSKKAVKNIERKGSLRRRRLSGELLESNTMTKAEKKEKEAETERKSSPKTRRTSSRKKLQS